MIQDVSGSQDVSGIGYEVLAKEQHLLQLRQNAQHKRSQKFAGSFMSEIAYKTMHYKSITLCELLNFIFGIIS